MFSPDEVKAAVSKALSTDITVPEGHKVALVTFVNTDKVEVAIATKLEYNWSVELIASHTWGGDSQVGAISKITW